MRAAADDRRAAVLTRAAVIGDITGAAQLELVKWLNTSLDAGMGNPERPPGILWPLLERLVGDKDFPLSRVEVVCGHPFVVLCCGHRNGRRGNLFRASASRTRPATADPATRRPSADSGVRRGNVAVGVAGTGIPRITTREVEIGGVTIPAHSAVWLALEAAGRENGGDEISTASNGEIRRQRHWAFGGGMHRCLGLHLARLEMAAFVTEWLSRIPKFELEPGSSPTIVHKPTGVTHLGSLMLRWSDDSQP